MNKKHFTFLTISFTALFWVAMVLVAAASPSDAQTFSYAGQVVPIPDGGNTSGSSPGDFAILPIVVSGINGQIGDIDFRFDGSVCTSAINSTTVGVDHSYIRDLEFTLTSPSGTAVTIVSHINNGGNNLCQTYLDDESSGPSIQSLTTTQAPFTGSFTPYSPLSAFDNENPNGTWKLMARDFYIQDRGNVRAFSLIITPLSTTAALVRVGGRALTSTGVGISGVTISITDSQGNARTATTSSSGDYAFDACRVGETYVVNASDNRYSFVQPSQILSVNNDVTAINFIASTPPKSRKRVRFF